MFPWFTVLVISLKSVGIEVADWVLALTDETIEADSSFVFTCATHV